MSAPAWIGLGSNLGDRLGALQSAIAALDRLPGTRVVAVSSTHTTVPVGGPPDQGGYLNAAAGLLTDLTPRELLEGLQTIEQTAGRTRTIRWGERSLDLDLLLYGDAVLAIPGLIVPHPRMALRRFVLAPLAEIAPGVVHPDTGLPIATLLDRLDRRPGLIAVVGPPSATRATVQEALGRQWPTLRPEQFETFAQQSLTAGSRSSPAPEPLAAWVLRDLAPGSGMIDSPPWPTFAVLIDPTGPAVPPHAVIPYPVLRPESSEPGAILAEVATTCLAAHPD